MGVVQLSKAILVLPRSDLPAAVRSLSAFGWFHPEQPDSLNPDPLIDSLATRALKVYVELEDLVKALRVQVEPGVIETIMKGVRIERGKFTARDWSDLIAKLEADAQPVIEELGSRLTELERLRKSASDAASLRSALQLLSELSVDLKAVEQQRRFYSVFSVVSLKDLREIQRSLTDSLVATAPITKTEVAALIVSSHRDVERVDRVLRSFDVKPFSIPGDLPQNPAEAFQVVEGRRLELGERLAELEEGLEKLSANARQKLLVLRETARTAHTVLSQMRKPGDLKRFAVVRGYIPSVKNKAFRERMGGWIQLLEPMEAKASHHPPAAAPTLVSNPGVTKPFENITFSQGPPTYSEVDPTPIISLVFPIFYGIMFGDLGHGLVLLFAGILLKARGNESMRQWGVIFATAGVAAAVVGLLIGEFFGLEIGHMVPSLRQFTLLHFVERLHGQPTISVDALKFMLKVSVIIGIIHLMLGHALNTMKDLKRKEYGEMLAEKLPTLFMYVGFVLLVFAFVGAGFSINELFTSQSPTPLFFFMGGPPVASTTVVSVGVLMAALIVYVLGRPLMMILGKIPKEDVGMSVLVGLIEGVFEKIPAFLANTVSYARLAILLTVHASLLMVLNQLWSIGLAALPLLAVFNLLIIILEALIVFVQDLRLHLYEWFTKFYEGTGVPFQRLTPATTHVDIEWE